MSCIEPDGSANLQLLLPKSAASDGNSFKSGLSVGLGLDHPPAVGSALARADRARERDQQARRIGFSTPVAQADERRYRTTGTLNLSRSRWSTRLFRRCRVKLHCAEPLGCPSRALADSRVDMGEVAELVWTHCHPEPSPTLEHHLRLKMCASLTSSL